MNVESYLPPNTIFSQSWTLVDGYIFRLCELIVGFVSVVCERTGGPPFTLLPCTTTDAQFICLGSTLSAILEVEFNGVIDSSLLGDVVGVVLCTVDGVGGFDWVLDVGLV